MTSGMGMLARRGLRIQGAVCALLLGLLSCVVHSAESLPESKATLCDDYELAARQRCGELHDQAAGGRGSAARDIGISLKSQQVTATDDWLAYERAYQHRLERAIRWFYLAKRLGLKDADFHIAETIKDAHSAALLRPPFEVPDAHVLLRDALKVGKPAEAVAAAKACADSPGCMEMLGEFHERGFGITASRALAAEWFSKAALGYLRSGARDASVRLTERLSLHYPDYPYTGEVVRRVFPPVDVQPNQRSRPPARKTET